MSTRDKLHIERIKSELSFIVNTLRDINKESFQGNDIIQHAICMSLIAIGESSNFL